MRRVSLFACLAALVVAASSPVKAQGPSALPAGDGRDLVATACSQCHSLGIITAVRDGTPGWKRHVYNMVLRGAQLAPREADTVIGYLSSHFGPGAPGGMGANAAAVTLPNGPGRELVESRCGACHDLQRITAVKRQKRDWDGIVANMYERFGLAAPDEMQTIAAYLVAQFGRE